MNRAELERVQAREDKLDLLLFKCMEIMQMPPKWSIDKDRAIITVYPHPIVSREAHRVNGIQYLPHKSYMLPDVLLERFIYWEGLLRKKTKAPKANKLGRPTKFTEDDVRGWIRLREQGKTYREIQELTGEQQTTISYNIKRYREAM